MSLLKWIALSLALMFVVQSGSAYHVVNEGSFTLYTFSVDDFVCQQQETPLSVQNPVESEIIAYDTLDLEDLITSAARGSVKNSGELLFTESGDSNEIYQFVETNMNSEHKMSDLENILDFLVALFLCISAVLLLIFPVIIGYVVCDLWFCEHPSHLGNGTQTPELTPVETLEFRQTEEEKEEDAVDQIEDTSSQLPTTPDESLPEFHQVGSYKDQDILPADLLEKLMEKMEEKFDVLNECDLDEKPIELAQAEIHSMSSEASLDEHPKVLAVDSLEVLKRQLGYKERQMTDGQDTDLCSDLICNTKSSSDYGEQHTENIEKVGPLSADSLERLIESIVNDAKKLAEEAKAEETSIDVPVIQEQEVVDKPEEIKPVATNKLKKLRKNGRKPRLVVDAPKNESNV